VSAGEGTSAGYPALVLFDLDGTLLDSAPDFVATIDRMRAARGEASTSLQALRPHVSRGARAMIAASFASLGSEERDAMVPRFLEIYQQELGRHGRPFDGVETLLQAIESAGSRWGIVTNKPEYLARQLLPLLGWEHRCAVLVGGDTLPVRKPDPEPLLHAARLVGVDVRDCVYVGDDERDILAARAAAMPSIAALWGYRLHDDDPETWQADCAVEVPQMLLHADVWPSLR
jgi:phosphoglycolate phosphatase